jgi:hypothetical protein
VTFSYPIPNLINGVSQQSPQQRRDTQCEEQINCINSPVDGNVARPGSDHVALLPAENFEGAFVKDVIRSDEEQYRIVISDGEIRVFDLLTGEEGEVTLSDEFAEDYLITAGEPSDRFSAVTVEDTTFIVNREVVVSMVTAPPPTTAVFEGFVHVRGGDYLNTYTVLVRHSSTWYTYFHSTPESTTSVQDEIKADYIADKLADALVAGQGGNPALGTLGFTVARIGSLIRIRRTSTNGGDFDVAGEDGFNQQKMLVFKDRISQFAQLPPICFDGTVLHIKGSAEDTELDYYVQFVAEGVSNLRGVWEECPKPGLPTFLNRDSMPHILRSLGNNEFEFGSETWSDRVAGDGTEKGRDPSFVGRPIEDLTFYRDRLGIMTESSMVLSKTSQLFTFFPDTVQTVLEDAPIDVRAIGATQIAILRHAVAHAESLFLWSDKIQFVVQAGEELSAKTIEIHPTTAFDYSPRIRPRGVGENLIFTYESGRFSQLAEQFATPQGVSKEAPPITDHVPRYVPSSLRWFAGSTTLKLYACNSSEEKNAIYIYNYFLVGEEKQQSAWSKLVFPAEHNVLWGEFDGHILHLMVQRPDGVAFERVDMSSARLDEGGYYLTRLDRRITEELCEWDYASETGRTTITLPYTVEDTEHELAAVVTRSGGSLVEGDLFTIESIDSNEVVVIGEIPEDAAFYFGFIPVAEYEFSPFHPKDERGAHIYERVQVKALNVAYSKTGWTRAVVTRLNGRTYDNVFAGRILGSPQNMLSQIAIADGTFRIPVKSGSDSYRLRLINDSPFPSAWQSATVDFRPTVRSQRVA